MDRTTTVPASDLAGVDRLLSPEDISVRKLVHGYLASEVAPHVARWFEQGEVDDVRAVTKSLGALGVLGMHLKGYGCAGMTATQYGLACQELEHVDSGLRSLVSVQGSLAMYAIRRFGSDTQKSEWLPPMAAGESIGCFGLTESDHGSDPGAMRTRARPAGGDWVLTGGKTWITNGSIADVAIVWAQTEDGIRGFVVPRGTPGFTSTPIKHKLSLRASVTAELVLDEVRVPGSAILPGATGLGAPLSCLNEARFGIAWGALGAARSALECATSYASSRTQFGRPIAGFQLIQEKLVDMSSKLALGNLLALHLGRLKDSGQLTPTQVSLGKLINVRSALEICRTARTILGANGISLEYPVIRHLVNLESVVTYEGTEEMHTLILGEALTGLSAFRG